MSEEEVTLVNEHDEVIGSGLRSQERKPGEFYRVATLWMTNSKKEILIAKRSLKKKLYPGLWGPSVAGTVAANESYEEAIQRETLEEIGVDLKNESLKELKKYSSPKSFTQWFSAVLDMDTKDMKLQVDEVDEVKWISPEQLREELLQYPEKYLKRMPKYVEEYA